MLKFHLRISKEEQRKRFLARLDEPQKRWKFSMNDIAERGRWDDYMAAFQDMIRETSTDYAPWYVIPADHKHVAWLIVSAAIIEALEGLKLEYPKVTGKALKELKKVARALESREVAVAPPCASAASSAKRRPVPTRVNAEFTLIRDLWTRERGLGNVDAPRFPRDDPGGRFGRARAALMHFPLHSQLLGGLLLLIAP